MQDLYAFLQEIGNPRTKIREFADTFGIDVDEAEAPIESYRRFDDFFTRRLRPAARPIDHDPCALIAPADCRLLFLPLTNVRTVTVKGRSFTLDRLLGSKHLAEAFEDGVCVSCRLSPADYHRFHYVDHGHHEAMTRMPGAYYPITPAFFERIKSIYTENRRDVCVLRTASFGTIVQVDVGGFAVGRIHQNHPQGARVERGSEKGYFGFGGSQILLFFQAGTVVPDADIAAQSRQNIETLVLLGERIGQAVRAAER